MYLGLGTFFAVISTSIIVIAAIGLYVWYYTFDENKKLPLTFGLALFSLYSINGTEYEIHEEYRTNHVVSSETDWRVNIVVILMLLYCIFNYIAMHYVWPITIPVTWYILKNLLADVRKMAKNYREYYTEYEI